ncbi:DUF4129 domain-containing protein [Desmospora activa]|uniref:Uncharacterized protein DUF4129 n=1 Tax=Desmospora activa DSM 45169 TaxID=1121389 RepID=A0A2T4ZAE9_9BACL|nr:DUF4129 domain-containing protein [Desmospora activa]PTM58870.1 uncharacterized protein DUF4129 [Desmospora activa DSM 45169]
MTREYEESRRQLSDILQQDEFQTWSWWQRLLDRIDQIPVIGEWSIGAWLNDLLSSLFRAGEGSGVGWLLPVVLAIILGLSMWFVLRQIYFSQPQQEKDTAAASGESMAVVWWERGEAYAAQREYREAIRCLFRHALEVLDERKILDRREHKTNREYREEIAVRSPALLPVFQSLIMRFELVWYGMIDPEEADYDDYRRLCQRLTGGGAVEAG